MKTLYFSGVYQRGHKYFDQKIISNLAAVSEVIVMTPPYWFSHKEEQVVYIENGVDSKRSRLPHLKLLGVTLKNYKKALHIARKNQIDCLIAGEYELLSVWFLAILNRKKLFLIHHYNLDQMERKWFFRFLFQMIKNKVHHVVLEPYIGTHLIQDLKVPKEKICCWPHPVEVLEREESKEEEKEGPKGETLEEYDCVGLSNSNDSEMVHRILQHEKNTQEIGKSDLKIIVKSSKDEYDAGGLKIIKGNLDQEMYERYIQRAKTMLVCFPKSYQYRVSAVIMESVRNFIPIIGSEFRLLTYYKKRYPNIFFLCNERNLKDVIRQAQEVPEVLKKKEFQEFIRDHSDEIIQKAMRESFQQEMIKSLE
ncbi:MAG: glycosyltransferase [Lachnospiraceae bacterium]|nr:glycosyltransferase [Lachnospiraceae bacterium]